MSWEAKLPRGGTKGELIARRLVAEIGLSYECNAMIGNPFRGARYGASNIEADLLVDDVLVIEIQSVFHSRKAYRIRKDHAKRAAFEHMGYGVLWLWNDELHKTEQKKYKDKWRPAVKTWIQVSHIRAKAIRAAYNRYSAVLREIPMVKHPVYRGIINLRKRND